MEDLLINTLVNAFGYPVILQGSLAPEANYPTHFFTYWNNSSDGSSFYNNDEGAVIWSYDLNFYSVSSDLVHSKLLEAKNYLKAAGFIVSGAGHSVMSDEPTHTGRGYTILYRQKL